MKNAFLTLALSISFSALAGQHEVPGFKVSTVDFEGSQKVSQDGRCTLKREDWTGEAWYSLYLYDQRDSNFQGSLAIRNIENGIELIAAEDINENCSIEVTKNGNQKTVTEKCDRFVAHEKISLTTDSEGLIQVIAIEKNEAGIGGHSIPFPYVYNKKITCKF